MPVSKKDIEESIAVTPFVPMSVHYRMRMSSGAGLATDEISLFDILMIFLRHQKVFWITFLSALLLLGAVFLSVGGLPATYQYQQLLRLPSQQQLQASNIPLLSFSQLKTQWQVDGQAQLQQAIQKNQVLQGLRVISVNFDHHLLPANAHMGDADKEANLLPPGMLLLTLKAASKQGLSDQQRLVLSQVVQQILSTIAQPQVIAHMNNGVQSIEFLKKSIIKGSKVLDSAPSAIEIYAQSQRQLQLEEQLRSLEFQQQHIYRTVSAVTDLAIKPVHAKVLLHFVMCLFLAGFLAVISVILVTIKQRFTLHRARHLEERNE